MSAAAAIVSSGIVVASISYTALGLVGAGILVAPVIFLVMYRRTLRAGAVTA